MVTGNSAMSTFVNAARRISGLLLGLVLLAGASLAFADISLTDYTLFGPTQYLPTAGAPNTYVDTFAAPTAVGSPFVVVVLNGNVNGSNRVSSATVKLNGVQIAGPADFGPKVPGLIRVVTLKPSNTLEVRLTSSPGAHLTVSVLGRRLLPVPTALAPNPVTITAGATGNVTATLAPAPTTAGMLTLSSANAALATVPASIAYAAGQTSVVIPVTGRAPGSTTITAMANGGSATATVQVTPAPPTVTNISPPSLSITQGASGTLSVAISSAQPTATALAVASSNASVASAPAIVTVPAGQVTAAIPVSGLSPGTAQLTATLNGSSASSQVTVTPAPPTVVSLLPVISTVTLGASTTLALTLSSVQPLDTVVALAASPQGIVSIPSQVVVPAGQTSASVAVGTLAYGQAGVTASLNGSTASAAVNVTPPPVAVAALTPATFTMAAGATSAFTVRINAAQNANTDIALAASNPSVLQAPASVTIAQGATSAVFTVTALATGDTTLTASANGTSKTAAVHVSPQPAALVSLLPNPLPLQQGAHGSLTVTINVAQETATPVALANSNPSVATVAASVVIPAGAVSAPVAVNAETAGSTQITATVNGASVVAAVDVTPPPPVVGTLAPAALALPKGTPGALRVTLSRAPNVATSVALSSNNPAIASVPPHVNVAAGALYAEFPVMANSEGPATITATLNGESASSAITVAPPEAVTLVLSPKPASAYIGEPEPFTATATMTDGTTQDFTTRVTWTSSNTHVATIASTGVASALGEGETTITATHAFTAAQTGETVTLTQTSVLTVKRPVALVLTAPTLTLDAGQSTTVTITSADPAPAEGLVVALTASGTGTGSFPPAVSLAANANTAAFTFVAGNAGTVTLVATAPNREPGTITLVVGSPLAIASITPTSGGIGTVVTLNGTGFDSIPGNNTLAFAGANNTLVPAAALSATATQIAVRVPQGAQTGPIRLTNTRGTVQSPPFTVTAEQDVQLVVSPATLTAYQGASNAAQVQLSSIGTTPFSGLATLSVQGLPAGVTASFSPAATLSAFQTGLVTFGASASAAPGSYAVTVQASFTQAGQPAARTAPINLTVGAAGNVTGVKGRFVTPQNQGIAGIIVRAETGANPQPQTTTDAAGNFTLVGLAAGPITLRFDATPANPLYPIWPYTMTLIANEIAVTPEWTIAPPPADDKFTPIANATQDQIITDPRFPGLEVKLPAGVTITGWDGVRKNRIAIERHDPDKLAVSAPPIPTRSVFQLYFGTPMGGLPSAPIPMTFPNDAGLDPGARTNIWYFDGSPMGGTGEWKIAGQGTVSPDGKAVVPDANAGIPRFCGQCGLACIENVQNRPPNGNGCGPRGGNPITLSTGQQLPELMDLSIDNIVPLDIGRSFNPFDAFQGIAGVNLSMGEGWVFAHDVTLLALSDQLVRVVLPGNARTDFPKSGDGTFRSSGDGRYEGAAITRNGDNTYDLRFADGTRWRFAPSGIVHYITEETDPNGNQLLIARRSNGRIDSIQGGSRAVAASYGANGFISEVRDGANRSVRYTYNASKRLETVTDVAGGVTRYTYVDDSEFAGVSGGACPDTAGGIRIKTTLYAGQTVPVENFYGPGRRVLRQTMPDGTDSRFSYKVNGACIVNIARPGQVCTGGACPTVDSWDNFQAGWRIYGGTIVSAAVTDARGNTTTHRLNPRGLEVEVTDALGQTVRSAMDANNRVSAVTDEIGRMTRFTYDNAGNVMRIRDHLGRFNDYTYDPKWNKLTSVTVYQDDGTPLVTRHAYDPNTGNLLESTSPRGLTTKYTYNSRGQMATISDPLGKVTRFGYAASGDIQSATDMLNNETTYASDAVGRAQRETDPLGRTSRFVLNERNQIVESFDPENLSTKFTYDARGNVTSIVDRAGRAVVQFTYDSMNRVETRTDMLGRVDRYTYDGNGNLIRHIDRAGQQHEFKYDALDRLIESRYSDGAVVTRSYDAAGRMTDLRDGEGAIAFDFDDADRTTRVTTPQGEIRYGYDGLDRLTRVEKPTGVETFQYDANSNLTRITRGSDVYEFVYDDADSRTELRLPNGVTAYYGYDDNARLASLTYKRGTTVLEALTYQYDAAGNILSKDRANISSIGETAFTATYDNANRMTGITLNGVAYTLEYDERGNLVRRVSPNDTITYTWDVRGRLTRINSGSVNATFRYDAFGRRVERILNGQATSYLYDGGQAAVEFGPNGPVDYVVGTDIDEVLARYSQTGNRWLLADHLGSVLGMTDGGGGASTVYAYSPYGETSALGANELNPLQYTGRENDGTGLYFYRARYYDPLLKRFVSEDPIGTDGGLNLYGYVGGDPIGLNDPSGNIAPVIALCLRFPAICRAAAQAIVRAVVRAIVKGARAVARGARNCVRPGGKGGGGPGGGGNGGGGPPGGAPPGKGGGSPPPPSNSPSPPSAGGGGGNGTGAGPGPGGTPGTNTPGTNTPNATGPKPNNGNAQPHGGKAHDGAINGEVDRLKQDPGVTNIRKNQQQVDVNGNKAGTNRPDVQYDKCGAHHCVEFDTKPSNGTRHEQVIRQNDPNARVRLKPVP